MGAVWGGGRAGVRSMSRCCVRLLVVQGRVEAAAFVNTGVLNDSWTLDASAACTARDTSCGPSYASLSASTIPASVPVRSTTSSVHAPRSSSVYLSAASNSRKPKASHRYLASSTPRLGPETCTRISVEGAIVLLLHLEGDFFSCRRSGLLFVYSNLTSLCVVQKLTSNDGTGHLF